MGRTINPTSGLEARHVMRISATLGGIVDESKPRRDPESSAPCYGFSLR
jgi:hypothetical protein